MCVWLRWPDCKRDHVFRMHVSSEFDEIIVASSRAIQAFCSLKSVGTGFLWKEPIQRFYHCLATTRHNLGQIHTKVAHTAPSGSGVHGALQMVIVSLSRLFFLIQTLEDVFVITGT